MPKLIYKPSGDGRVGTGKATFYIENRDLVLGGWYNKDGELVERFQSFVGTPEGGAPPAIKFYGNKPGGAYGEDLIAKFTDKSGKQFEFNIPDGNQRTVGDFNDPSSLKADHSRDGSGSGGTSGVPGQFQPGMAGQYGAIPAYIGDLFPDAKLAQYNPITAANYNFTDPFKFAEKYGDFSRKEVSKNFTQAQDMALSSLDTELKGLQGFAPAAAALKRQEISLDNQFNQAQRTQQVDQALPGVRGDLEGQRGRALSYASGKIPDDVADKGLEIGLRSQAADAARVGGFGASSSVARKASDLLSAEKRVQLSQYGDQLLGNNINAKANLFLAPTEYANAGAQVNINPTTSTTQLASAYTGSLNQMAGLPTTQAFSSQIGQEQYQTGLNQQTNMYNATNTLQNNQFNANNLNNFALSKFGYQAGYANSVAGGTQTDINTQFGVDQQNMFRDIMEQYAQKSQDAGMIGSLFQLGGLGMLTGGKLAGGGSGKGGGSKGGGSKGGGNSLGGGLADAASGGIGSIL